MKPRIAILAFFVLLTAAGAAATSGGEGDGYIGCQLRTPVGSGTCFGIRPSIQPPQIPIEPGQTLSVSVTWTPSFPTNDVLALVVSGSNPDCRSQCDWWSIGRSPLVLDVEWPANATDVAHISVGGPGVCHGPFALTPAGIVGYISSCETPPVRMVRDQPFHYQWSLT